MGFRSHVLTSWSSRRVMFHFRGLYTHRHCRSCGFSIWVSDLTTHRVFWCWRRHRMWIHRGLLWYRSRIHLTLLENHSWRDLLKVRLLRRRPRTHLRLMRHHAAVGLRVHLLTGHLMRVNCTTLKSIFGVELQAVFFRKIMLFEKHIGC